MNTDHEFDRILAHMPALDGPAEATALAAYQRIAADGRASPTEIAESADIERATVESLLDSWPGVYRDDSGSVVGFWGLTAEPVSPHQLQHQGRLRYAWCAWDTLFLPQVLDSTLQVHSRCALTKQPVELDISPQRILSNEPLDLLLSFPRLPDDPELMQDVIGNFCHHVHFLASPAAATRWVAEHPDVFVVDLAAAYELAARLNRQRFPRAFGPTAPDSRREVA